MLTLHTCLKLDILCVVLSMLYWMCYWSRDGWTDATAFTPCLCSLVISSVHVVVSALMTLDPGPCTMGCRRTGGVLMSARERRMMS